MKFGAFWKYQAGVAAKKSRHGIRDTIFCQKQRVIVIYGDQTPIEHPMHCAAKRDAVPNAIRPTVVDG